MPPEGVNPSATIFERMNVQFNYLNSSIADAHTNLGIRRSKVSRLPDPEYPAKPLPVRMVLFLQATCRALKALRRHGEKSYQFQKALRSKWRTGFMGGSRAGD